MGSLQRSVERVPSASTEVQRFQAGLTAQRVSPWHSRLFLIFANQSLEDQYQEQFHASRVTLDKCWAAGNLLFLAMVLLRHWHQLGGSFGWWFFQPFRLLLHIFRSVPLLLAYDRLVSRVRTTVVVLQSLVYVALLCCVYFGQHSKPMSCSASRVLVLELLTSPLVNRLGYPLLVQHHFLFHSMTWAFSLKLLLHKDGFCSRVVNHKADMECWSFVYSVGGIVQAIQRLLAVVSGPLSSNFNVFVANFPFREFGVGCAGLLLVCYAFAAISQYLQEHHERSMFLLQQNLRCEQPQVSWVVAAALQVLLNSVVIILLALRV